MVSYFLNFLIILFSITVFIGIFYGWYVYQHRPKLANYQDFNKSLEYFFSSQQANVLVLTWAAAEAVVWFVIPEFLLILVIFMRIRQKRKMLLYDLYGTVIGTVIAMAIAFPPATIAKLPYIQPAMVTQVQHWYTEQGIWGLMHQPFSGVPYKVFTNLAPSFHFSVIAFLVLAVVLRLFRYIVVYGVGIGAYPLLHKYVYRHYVYLYIGVIALFTLLLLRVYNSFA